jgi:hypothetical protein
MGRAEKRSKINSVYDECFVERQLATSLFFVARKTLQATSLYRIQAGLASVASSGIFEILLTNCLTHRFPQAGIAGQFRRLARRFPSEVGVIASEMTVSRGLFVNRPPQVQ